MITNKAQKIRAYRELWKIAQRRSFEIYFTAAGEYGRERSWPLHCFEPLYRAQNRQEALNDTLHLLTKGERPKCVRRLEEERRIVRLVLKAGANPNYSSDYDLPKAVFDSFMQNGKFFGALEVAKTDGFVAPENPEETFGILSDELRVYLNWGCSYPAETKAIADLYARECQDQKELVYWLFKNGIRPNNPKLRQTLQPIFEEERQKRSISQRTDKMQPQVKNALRMKQKAMG